MNRFYIHVLALVALSTVTCTEGKDADWQWLAGDTHIHSHWSPGYDRTVSPPTPIQGGDANYSTPTNASQARNYGLSWMVTTDHGGPNHAKFNLNQAYPELKTSRTLVPDVLQFYGMELNMPSMDHHTLIVPHSEEEASVLFDIERQFDAREAWPEDPTRNTSTSALKALAFINNLPRLPLLFANHPSRSATAIGDYGLDEPSELRHYHDAAPNVYHGMEGAPGHQAATLTTNENFLNDAGHSHRGFYTNPGAHTLGGFDQMTAIVGGLWDSLLGEGRRFWILASSDSHMHYADPVRPGIDFWPGEFHKTYVWAMPTYNSVLDSLRAGRIFVVAGDLIDNLEVIATARDQQARIGETLSIVKDEDITLTIKFRDPDVLNAGGYNPHVQRLDVIVGEVAGSTPDQHADRNETTKVWARLDEDNWKIDNTVSTMSVTIPKINKNSYIRVRGTNTEDLEPLMDKPGENPWFDLWFYSNPVFIEIN